MSTEGITHHHILPIVIAPQVWEMAVSFPEEPELEFRRLGLLLAVTLRSYCNAEPEARQVDYELHYMSPEKDRHTTELLKLQLTQTKAFLSVHLSPTDIQ